MFQGYAKLGFVDMDGNQHQPGEKVELPDDTTDQQKDIDGLRRMGVIVVDNPAGIPDDAATFSDQPDKPKTRMQAKLAEKAAREQKD